MESETGIDLEKVNIKGLKIIARGKLSGKAVGISEKVIDTPLGPVVVGIDPEGKSIYVPKDYITRITDSEIILGKKQTPYREKFWEKVTSFVPTIGEQAIGTIEEVKTVNGTPCAVISLFFALPENIKEVWYTIRDTNKIKKKYLKFMTKEGYPYPLAYLPQAVASVANKYGVEYSKDLFTSKIAVPLSEFRIIGPYTFDLGPTPKILERETYTPDTLDIIPKPVRIETSITPKKVNDALTLLSGYLKAMKYKVKKKADHVDLESKGWLKIRITPIEEEGKRVSFEIAITSTKKDIEEALMGYHQVSAMKILALGYIGLIWAMHSAARKIIENQKIITRLLKDPRESEEFQNIISSIKRAEDALKRF
ncbi:MAG: hypothetical protein J7L47_00145 [Candidatus Odinarchaeota archaeon]|nr:hypothetical protein [Candidatus Odinarchaeota archaeon]